MNKANIRKLALAILNTQKRKGKQIGYNQNVTFFEGWDENDDQSGHHCGTVACIAGHASILAGGAIKKSKRSNTHYLDGDVFAKAKKYLGITKQQVDDLFPASPRANGHYLHDVKAAEAALVLFNLAETGLVDWTVARPELVA